MNLNITLSERSIDSAIAQLNALAYKLDRAPDTVCDTLGSIALAEMTVNQSAILDQDGNELGAPYMVSGAGEVEVGLTGDQVAFLEFGTGPVGAATPHPEPPSDWEYGAGETISENGDWRYYDKQRGYWRLTTGIPAYMPVFNAAQVTRAMVDAAVKEALK